MDVGRFASQMSASPELVEMLEVLQGAMETLKTQGLKLAIASYHSLPDGTPEIPLIVSFLEERGFNIIKVKGLREYVYACKVIETVLVTVDWRS